MKKTYSARTLILAGSVLLQLGTFCFQSRGASDEPLNIVTVAGKGLDIGDGGQATAGQLSNVRNADFDSSGHMYIVDFTGHRIRKVDKTTGIITTVAGTGVAGSVGDGGPATAAQIDGPGGVAFDSSGNLYISEFFGHRVRKVDTTGIITTVAGTGVAGYSLMEDGGPSTLARLNQPTGIAVDSSGNLYIADELNHRIRKVAAGIITTVAGTGVAGYAHPGCPAGDGCSAVVARLANPADVAVDTSGNLYITDTQNHRIRKVNTTGTISTVAGTGVAGYSLLEDGGPATLARINLPRGVAVDSSGNLYIGEFNGHRVRKVSTTGTITTVAGTGAPGYSLLEDGGSATAAQLASPAGVAIDSLGDLYIADFSNLRIRKVAAGIITTVAGGGVLPLYDGSPATLGQLNGPRDVVVDSSGNIYIADFNNQSVRKVSTTGIITTVAGTGIAGYSLLEDGGPATLARLNGPWGLAVDSSGNLYIADSNNSRIRKVDRMTGIITTVAGTGTAGYAHPGCPAGDGCSATEARINVPRGLAADPSGNLYIADVGYRFVYRYLLTILNDEGDFVNQG